MDRRRLDDRARRRHEPVEALRRFEPGDRPGVRRTLRDPDERVEVRRDGVRSAARRERREHGAIEPSARGQEAPRPAQEHDAGVESSPRSIRGTTRSVAYWNGLAGTLGLLREAARRLEPQPQVLRVALGGLVQPPAGTAATAASTAARAGPARRGSASAIGPAAGSSTWSRMAGKRAGASLAGSGPAWCA